MGGFFGAISRKNCKYDVFFGTDYHSHLGTKRGGMAFYSEENGFQRQIHNIENTPFRTKFEKDLGDFCGNSGIGFAAARGFLFLGATVVLACRSEQRARIAQQMLQREFPTATVKTAPLDLASNASIDAFAIAEGSRTRTVLAGIFFRISASIDENISTYDFHQSP